MQYQLGSLGFCHFCGGVWEGRGGGGGGGGGGEGIAGIEEITDYTYLQQAFYDLRRLRTMIHEQV